MDVSKLYECNFTKPGTLVSKDFETIRMQPAGKAIMSAYTQLFEKNLYVMRTVPKVTAVGTGEWQLWFARIYMNDLAAWNYCGFTPEAAVVATLQRVIADHEYLKD